MAQTCDMWSNESILYHPEFGGTSVQCWMGLLGYECSLMNTAIATKQEKTLRDLYMLSDRARGPEGHILAYDNAYEIGQAIVENGNDYYLRSRAAGLKAAEILQRDYAAKQLQLTKKQLDVLNKIQSTLEALPTETDKFVEQCTAKYKDLVPNFNPKNYEL